MELWAIAFGLLLTVSSGVVSFFAGLRKSRNDVLQAMQASINMLVDENGKLVKQVVAMNDEIIGLRKENGQLKKTVDTLNKKIEQLKKRK